MDGSGMMGTVWAGLGGLAATAVTGWVAMYLRKTDPTTRGEYDQEQAAKGIKFLSDWTTVKKNLANCAEEEAQRIQPLLNSMLDKYEAAWNGHMQYEDPGQVGFCRRWLLFYIPVKPFGWVFRAIYYMLISMFAFMFFVVMTPEKGQSAENLLVGFLVAAVIFAIPMLFIRWRAVRYDKKAFDQLAE